MKDDEREEFERWWKDLCQRTAQEGNTEAYLVAEDAWEACCDYQNNRRPEWSK